MNNNKPDPHTAARLLGKMGGHARAAALSSKKRKEIARKGGLARWGKLNTPESNATKIP